jgi:hypothetical protein
MAGTITAKNGVRLEDFALTYTTGGSVGFASDVFDTIYLQIGGSVLSATAPSASTTVTFNGLVSVEGTVPVRIYSNIKSTSAT